MKHKHAELIHAWADGAVIQVSKQINGIKEWLDVEHPIFLERAEYRIKPEEKKPVVRYLWREFWTSKINPLMRSEREHFDFCKTISIYGNIHFERIEDSRREFTE